MRILVAGHVIFGKVQEFCLSLTIPFLDVHQILTWDDDWETLVLLNTNGGWYISFALRLKMTSWSCLKPDWFDEISLFSIKKLNILLNINLSRIFPQIGNNMELVTTTLDDNFLVFVCPFFREWEQY